MIGAKNGNKKLKELRPMFYTLEASGQENVQVFKFDEQDINIVEK